MKIDRDQFRLHAAWGGPAILLLLAVCVWYFSASYAAGRWLRGGSLVGLSAGILAGLIILFEMMLWPRKLLRRLRVLPTKHWMAAHIWLGLVCLPLAVIHSGFHWGGFLPSMLSILLAITVLSGVYGLAMQQVLPGWMLRHLPAETIYSQIHHVARQAAEDARRLLWAACGPDPFASSDSTGNAPEHKDTADFETDNLQGQAVVVGAIREVGRSRGRALQTQTVYSHREDAAILWTAFREIEPFLLHGKSAGGPVAERIHAGRWFERLRRTCHDSSGTVISNLEALCDQRHQFDLQRRVHGWLHGWIPWHVAFSVAVVVMLLAHVWTALKFW